MFSLFASLKLDTSEYKKGIADAKKSGEDFADHTQKKVSPKAVAGWAAIVAIIIKAVTAVKRLATESMNYADEIGDLAAKYGVTTDAISEMQYIADQSSTSIDGLTSSMKMLYSRAKENGDVFKRLGVSVKDSNGEFKAMDEVFWETVGALNDIENEGEKSAYMLDLFGRNAIEVGEVLRKDTQEIERMRKEAHELGIVLNESTINWASDFNDKVAVLKLQMRSAMASMAAGAPDAEERFDKFFQNLLETVDRYMPAFVQFFVRFAHSIGTQFMTIAPGLVADVISVVIDAIFDTDWIKVGIDLGLAIIEGVLNVFHNILDKIGLGGLIPKVDLNVGGYYGKTNSISDGFDTSEYEISENIRQDITVKVEASGDSEVSKETAEKTAEALAPYIDKILGGR